LLHVDDIVNYLSDGRWHSVSSLAKRFNISEDVIKRVLDFLADFDFIVLDAKRNRVKVSEDYLSFMRDTLG